MVSVTSARPSGGRSAVPAKMTSSILPPRSALAPCSPSTQAIASTTLDLPDPFGPDHRGDARLEPQRGRRGEGLEALEGQGLQMHEAESFGCGSVMRAPPLPASAGTRRAGQLANVTG